MLLKDLEGMWKGEGRGVYPPRVGEFHYVEELTITALPKPNTWELRSVTKHKETGKPMHSEVGFIRCPAHNNESTRGNIEFCLVHPFGVTEVSEGQFNEETGTLEVRSSGEGLSRTKTAKTPFTTELRRVYQLKQGEEQDKYLHFIFDMATTTSPMQNHLEARLYKVST
jgi:hypothetical protein